MKSKTPISPPKNLADLPQQLLVDMLLNGTDVSILIDPANRVVDARCTLAGFPDDAALGWLGGTVGDIFEEDSFEKLDQLLADARSGTHGHWRQLNNRASHMARGLAVDYVALPIESTNYVLMMGRDLSQVSLLQQRLMRSQLSAQREYENHRTEILRYRDLLEFVAAPLLILSPDKSRIVEANSAAALLLLGATAERIALQNISFPHGVAEISDVSWVSHLPALFEQAEASPLGRAHCVIGDQSSGAQQSLGLVLQSRGEDCFVMLSLTENRQDLIYQGRPSMDVIIQQSDDAYLLLDQTGIILDANKGFFELLGLREFTKVVGVSLDEWLDPRGLAAEQLVRQMERSGRSVDMPLCLRDRTGWISDVDACLIDLGGATAGMVGMILRDPRKRNQDATGVHDLNAGINQLAPMVGHRSLKEIVNEATDIIEHMCIKAALDITADNRAAAADLLGISRQSLYVKMRKFREEGPASELDMKPVPDLEEELGQAQAAQKK